MNDYGLKRIPDYTELAYKEAVSKLRYFLSGNYAPSVSNCLFFIIFYIINVLKLRCVNLPTYLNVGFHKVLVKCLINCYLESELDRVDKVLLFLYAIELTYQSTLGFIF